MNRREFLAASAGATATVAVGSEAVPQYSPVGRARAVVPVVPIGAAAGGLALGYLVNEVVDYITGDDAPDEEEYQEYDSAQTHLEIYERAMSMNGGDDTVATVMNNRIEDSHHTAWSIGKEAAVEQLNLGNTQSEAETAAHDAVNDYYTTMQRNVMNHFQEQINKIKISRDMVADDANLAYEDVFRYGVSGSVTYQNPEFPTETLNLEDGSEILDFEGFQLRAESDGSTTTYLTRWQLGSGLSHGDSSTDGGYNPPEDYNENVYPFNWDGANDAPSFPLADRWNDIKSTAQQMRDNLTTWVDSLYTEYEPDELSLMDFTNAAELAAEYSTEYNETGYYAFAAAELAALNLPGNFDRHLKLDLHDSEVTVQGVLFSQKQPESGWEVGVRYDPDNYAGETWLAYEYVNDDGETVSELVELTQEFTVVAAENVDGESVDRVQMRDYNYQTSNVTMTQDELDQLYELRQELEAARDAAVFSDDGAAGGTTDDGISTNTLVAIGAIVAAGLLARDSNGGGGRRGRY